ncbi:hypothetical protein FRC17_002778 [Serendipita sp. 399]|nr:hypothetical protein FRC17_002778 [Serendipita sp. 399]
MRNIFPIEKCNVDVLGIILQHVVEEEARSFVPHRSYIKTPRAKAVFNLMQVCRHWHQVVTSTSCLWKILILSLNKPKQSVWETIKQFALFAKSGEVDVYIYDIHSHPSPYLSEHPFETCASHKPFLVDILHLLPNIRKLFLEYSDEFAAFGDVWSETPTIRHLHYCGPPDSQGISFTSLTEKFPHLIHISLDNPGSIDRIPESGVALFPDLRVLELKFTESRTLAEPVMRLLSHCPNLEGFTYLGSTYGAHLNQAFSSLQLEYLRDLEMDGSALPDIFIHLIETPDLRRLCFRDNSSRTLRDLVKKNPRIEDLAFHARDSSCYGEYLELLPHISCLSIRATGRGAFLSELYRRSSKGGRPICASTLRKVRMIIPQEHPVGGSHFEKFVEARCIPANREGLTSAGCLPLAELVLEIPYPDKVLTEIYQCASWKKAKVTKEGDSVFVLQWSPENSQAVRSD